MEEEDASALEGMHNMDWNAQLLGMDNHDELEGTLHSYPEGHIGVGCTGADIDTHVGEADVHRHCS